MNTKDRPQKTKKTTFSGIFLQTAMMLKLFSAVIPIFSLYAGKISTISNLPDNESIMYHAFRRSYA